MVLSYKDRSQKLRHVAELFHCHDAITMLLFFRDRDEKHAAGICTNSACMHVSTDVDRLEEHGHCPACHTDSVESVLVMAGVV